MNDKDVLISIIVPIYNGEKYLDRCIESVMNQTYKDFELILVNDGSKDKSGEICQNYANTDSRIKYIQKANGGEGSARNAGLEIINSRYVTFLDCDDELPSTAIEFLMKEAGKYDLIIGGLKKDNNRDIKEYVPKRKSISGKKEISENLISETYFLNIAVGKLYRTDIIKKNNCYFMDFKYGTDTYFDYFYLKLINTALFVDSSVYTVHEVLGSMSLRPVKNSWKYMKTIFELGRSIDSSNKKVESQLLMRSIKTSLLLEEKMGYKSFKTTCNMIAEYTLRTGINSVNGLYNKIILNCVLNKRYRTLYYIMQVRNKTM